MSDITRTTIGAYTLTKQITWINADAGHRIMLKVQGPHSCKVTYYDGGSISDRLDVNSQGLAGLNQSNIDRFRQVFDNALDNGDLRDVCRILQKDVA